MGLLSLEFTEYLNLMLTSETDNQKTLHHKAHV